MIAKFPATTKHDAARMPTDIHMEAKPKAITGVASKQMITLPSARLIQSSWLRSMWHVTEVVTISSTINPSTSKRKLAAGRIDDNGVRLDSQKTVVGEVISAQSHP